MGEEFQGGVCGGTWWNPPHNIFSSGLSTPCSVAQLSGGSFDVGSFGWPNEVVVKGSNNKSSNNNSVFDNLIFPDQIDSSLDILGFGLSPTSSTTDWNNHHNLLCDNNGSNEANFDSMLQDNMNSSRLCNSYEMGVNSPNIMNSTNFSNNTQDASPPLALTASSNSSGDSSTITCDGSLATSFPMNSSASYFIQSLFDDSDESHHQVPQPQFISHHHHNQFINSSNNYGSLDSSNEIMSSNSWVKTSPNNTPTLPSPQIPLLQSNKIDGGMNASLINDQGQVFSGQYSPTTLSSIRASLLNSLQSRARGPSSFNHKSHSSNTLHANKGNSEEHRRESKNNTSNNDQPQAKRPRIETPSPLPTFKVRKEKLGDRITALQQLVSPFGKTDTASVLHEAIEYIKFLHDQVNVLSTPYLKNGTAMQQKESDKLKDNEDSNQDLRSRGLCLVPISSTYPVAQETPVDFWTPTFGGTTTFM
ncbi:transcription factor bHLH123-like [Chenopodium quinoa]|uniref:transcription factor bHLH123-like n=1 Tax=Chenopodium quinoa TaxID=63459 RepID=UPI000B77507D|nr:transcription factor bHLH123-like [Chenopodium quinoa]